MALLLAAFVAGCGSNSSSSPTQSSTKALTAFSFNGYTAYPGLITAPSGLTPGRVAVILPNGTNVTTLVAKFATTGQTVTVGGTTQGSGITPNDFTTPVSYDVTAGDGTQATYNVTVSIAPANAKLLTAFSFVGFPGNSGTITEPAHTVAVTLPYGTSLTGLVATFTTTGASVTVAGKLQESSTTPNDFPASPVSLAYTIHAADTTTAVYNVTVTVALNPAKDLSAFSFVGFPAASGVITAASGVTPGTVAVTLPFGTSVTALTAIYATSGASVTVGGVTQTSGGSLTAPSNDFTKPVAYTVHAADTTTAIYNVTVTVVATQNPTAATLGEAGRFVLLASQSVTTTGVTAISNGDIGILDIARTGFKGFTTTGPAGDFTELTGSTWVGMLSTSYAPDDTNPPFPAPLAYAPPHGAYATTLAMINQARTDLGVAYGFLTGTNPTAPTTTLASTELGGTVVTPGVYFTASPLLVSTALQLDAKGDKNAVWIFTTDSSLTTGATGNISFVSGIGQAKNVFWRVGGTATIAANTTFLGSVFAYANVDVLSGAVITGSLFSKTAAVTLIANKVTKAP
jgi:Ice-binding-like